MFGNDNDILSYAIVDDDSLCRFILDSYLQRYPFFKSIAVLSSANQLISVLKENNVDIVFSDIEMPEVDGISLMKEIKDLVSYSVFITSYPNYAVESYKLNVNDYLLKPIDEVKIEELVLRIRTFFDLKKKAALYDADHDESRNITIKDRYSRRVINIRDIAYLKAEKDYTKIVLLNDDSIMMHGNLSTVLKNDAFKSFVRIHKSYAAKMQFIKTIDTSSLTLINSVELPLGRSYKKEILGLF